MAGFFYLSLDQLIDLIDAPYHSLVLRIAADNHELFRTVQGSSHNHQAWFGGYLDHVREVMNLAVIQYDALGRLRPLPFSLSDALLVLFLHDLEKPWKYREVGGRAEIVPELTDKAKQREFRERKLDEYGIVLTEAQANAMRFVEGEHNDYSPTRRAMNELAAFCHVCDVLSARLWYDYPQDDDPWVGASRIR